MHRVLRNWKFVFLKYTCIYTERTSVHSTVYQEIKYRYLGYTCTRIFKCAYMCVQVHFSTFVTSLINRDKRDAENRISNVVGFLKFYHSRIRKPRALHGELSIVTFSEFLGIKEIFPRRTGGFEQPYFSNHFCNIILLCYGESSRNSTILWSR